MNDGFRMCQTLGQAMKSKTLLLFQAFYSSAKQKNKKKQQSGLEREKCGRGSKHDYYKDFLDPKKKDFQLETLEAFQNNKSKTGIHNPTNQIGSWEFSAYFLPVALDFLLLLLGSS